MYFVWDFLILMWFFWEEKPLGWALEGTGSSRWIFQLQSPRKSPAPAQELCQLSSSNPDSSASGLNLGYFYSIPFQGKRKIPLQNSNFTFSSCWYPKNILGGKKNSKCAALGGKNGFKGKFHLISHLREQNTRAKSSWQWNQGYFWTLYFHFSAPSSPFPPLQDFPKVDFSEVRNQICKSKGLQEIKGSNAWKIIF